MARSKPILLIDGENILHQSFHKFEKLHSTDGKPSGAIYGFLRSLSGYITRFDPGKVIITFDNGHSPFRVKLNPNYKIHRQDLSFDRESLQKQKAVILDILGMLRVPYIYDKSKSLEFEGDDFLAHQAVKYSKKGYKVIVVSSDKDFNQLLVLPLLKIYNPNKEGYVTRTTCKEIYGYTPEETVPYLSMVGDKSDDIPGVRGIGPVKARRILDVTDNFWEFAEENFNSAEKEILKRNQQLIDLFLFLKMKGKVKIPKCEIDKPIRYKKFKEVCIDYSFNSFMTTDFIKPFKLLNNE